MSVRPPRAAPAARNLDRQVVVRFTGDPAGEAITQGAYAGITPGLAGRAGYVYLTDPGSMERAWHGYAASPQSFGQFTSPGGTGAVFTNGPNDVSSTISSDAPSPFADARYRALAQRMIRST